LSFHTFISEHYSPALECPPRNSSLDVAQYGKMLATTSRRNQRGGCAKFSGCISFGFKALSQNCDKQLWSCSFVISIRSSVHLYAWNKSATIGRFFTKFDAFLLSKTLSRKKTRFVKLGQNNGYLT